MRTIILTLTNGEVHHDLMIASVYGGSNGITFLFHKVTGAGLVYVNETEIVSIVFVNA